LGIKKQDLYVYINKLITYCTLEHPVSISDVVEFEDRVHRRIHWNSIEDSCHSIPTETITEQLLKIQFLPNGCPSLIKV